MIVFLYILTALTGIVYLLFLSGPFLKEIFPFFKNLTSIYENQALFIALSLAFLSLFIFLSFTIFKKGIKKEIISYNEKLMGQKESENNSILNSLAELNGSNKEGMENIVTAIKNNSVNSELVYIRGQLSKIQELSAEIAVKLENKAEESTEKEVKNLVIDIKEHLLNLENMAKNTMDNL